MFPWRALESYPRDGSTLARCGVWILVLLAAVPPVGTVCGCGRGQEKNGTSGEHLDGHFAGGKLKLDGDVYNFHLSGSTVAVGVKVCEVHSS